MRKPGREGLRAGEPTDASRLKPAPGPDDARRMIEMLLVLFVVGLAAALGLVGTLVPAEWVVRAGWICTAAGLLLGVPTGLWYHIRLHASLSASGRLSPRWWLRPVSLHDRLGAEQRPSVMRWFVLGGAGFSLAVLGCLLVGAGVVLEGVRAGVF